MYFSDGGASRAPVPHGTDTLSVPNLFNWNKSQKRTVPWSMNRSYAHAGGLFLSLEQII